MIVAEHILEKENVRADKQSAAQSSTDRLLQLPSRPRSEGSGCLQPELVEDIPPFSLVGKTLQKIQRDRVEKAIIIAPSVEQPEQQPNIVDPQGRGHPLIKQNSLH